MTLLYKRYGKKPSVVAQIF